MNFFTKSMDMVDRMRKNLHSTGEPIAHHVVILQGPDDEILSVVSDGPHFVLAIKHNSDGTERERKAVRQNDAPSDKEVQYAQDLVYKH